MMSFIRSARNEGERSDDFGNVEDCPEFALGGFKRLMTELDNTPRPWSVDHQPVPSELLVNLLNALELEGKQDE